METDWRRDKWFNGKALIRKAREAEQSHYCQLGKLAVVGTASDFGGIRKDSVLWEFVATGLRMDKGGFQNLDGVLAPVQCGDRVDIQIHSQPMTELIGNQLWIDTRLSGQTGMGARAATSPREGGECASHKILPKKQESTDLLNRNSQKGL